MLSIQFIRDHADRVRRDMERRGADIDIDRLLTLDGQRRELVQRVESLRAERNAASKEISKLRDKEERDQRIAAMREVGDRIDALQAELRTRNDELDALLYVVPNILSEDVPPGQSDTDNIVLRTVGEIPQFSFTPRPHWELGELLNGIDTERGAKMAGSRFYLLRGGVAKLYRALIQWLLDDHVREAGFVEHYLPDMLTEPSLYASGHLPKFRDNLYHDEEDDYYFIPTAEASFANIYRDEILPVGWLPKHFVAHTPCFRREKMSAGRDVRGIKRGHQFEKVEMFVFAEPEESDRELDRLVDRACSVAGKLGLPYRVLQLCAGDVDFKAAKAFDIELWAAGSEEWLEVSSASDTLDFQARRANIRYRPAPDAPTRFPHLLNASGLGMPRTLIAVMENYQQEDGTIRVPDVLLPYMGGQSVIEPVAI